MALTIRQPAVVPSPRDPRRCALIPGAGTAEHDRLAALRTGTPWQAWGPYVAERAWGTVREDYSADGDAWTLLPARPRAVAGLPLERGRPGRRSATATSDCCLGLALWNGVDPILKERIVRPDRPRGQPRRGRQGLLVVPRLDADALVACAGATTTRSAPFPYDDLVAENARRGQDEPEYELVDTGVFDDDRYWVVDVDYAKAGPHDLLHADHGARTRAGGGDAARAADAVVPQHLGLGRSRPEARPPPIQRAGDRAASAEHPTHSGPPRRCAGDGEPEPLFCDNETNATRLYGVPGRSAYPKDGDQRPRRARRGRRVNPARDRHQGGAALRLDRRRPAAAARSGCGSRRRDVGRPRSTSATGFAATMAGRAGAEADAFYAAADPGRRATADEAQVAPAGVRRADVGQAVLPLRRRSAGSTATRPSRRRRRNALTGRNAALAAPQQPRRDLDAGPVGVPLVRRVGPRLPLRRDRAHRPGASPRASCSLLLREWYQHPERPAAGLRVGVRRRQPAGARVGGAARLRHRRRHATSTSWPGCSTSCCSTSPGGSTARTRGGNNVFEGGFLGLDNIGPIDRSAPAAGDRRGSSRPTAPRGWRCTACDLLEIAHRCSPSTTAVYEDLATKFLEHFAYIADALRRARAVGRGGRLLLRRARIADGTRMPAAGALDGRPAAAAARRPRWPSDARAPARLRDRLALVPRQQAASTRDVVGGRTAPDGHSGRLLSIVDADRLARILARMLDEDEFLSPHGLRSLSAAHRDAPVLGRRSPARRTPSTTSRPSRRSALFGGNSNWRGPVWFPVNVLLVEALRRFAAFYGDELRVEHPTGSRRASSPSTRSPTT